MDGLSRRVGEIEEKCDQAFYLRKNRAFFWLCSKSKDSGVYPGWFRTVVIFPDIKKVDQETCANKGYLAFASIVVHKFESGEWKEVQGKYDFFHLSLSTILVYNCR